MSEERDNRKALQAFFAKNRRITVLTGAGISLAGGIPTYRDAAGTWQHSEPVKHQEFLQEPARRQRYWARSMRGWPPVRDAQPTAAHAALAALERRGQIELLITQNVDRLHQRAGSQQVVDLHGRLDRVRCLDCGRMHCRNRVQEQLASDNPQHGSATSPRPDGDADLPEVLERQLVIPG
jgi:NAD-dependent SIR2 family protein deacetylase